jgi:hypothetical protein
MGETHREDKTSPSELAARLDRILAEGERLIALVPEARIDDMSPTGDRPLRDLAFQLFRESLAFADALDRGRLPPAWLDEKAPRDLSDGRAIARYGALVRGRLAGWFEGAGPAEYSRVIDVDHGTQVAHDLLERTTRRAAEQLRQLRTAIVELDLAPPDAR